MTGERNLHGRSEDAEADVRVAVRRIHEDRLREVISRASGWSWSSGMARASVKTASWFPASGRSVKTSQTT